MMGPAETGSRTVPSRVLPFPDTFLSVPDTGKSLRIALTDRGVTPRFDHRRHRFVHRSRMDDDRTSAGPVALAQSRSLAGSALFVDVARAEQNTQPSPAPRFSRTPAVVDGPPCVPGQHTDEVLADWLN
jgi:hypothetical protein